MQCRIWNHMKEFFILLLWSPLVHPALWVDLVASYTVMCMILVCYVIEIFQLLTHFIVTQHKISHSLLSPTISSEMSLGTVRSQWRMSFSNFQFLLQSSSSVLMPTNISLTWQTHFIHFPNMNDHNLSTVLSSWCSIITSSQFISQLSNGTTALPQVTLSSCSVCSRHLAQFIMQNGNKTST